MIVVQIVIAMKKREIMRAMNIVIINIWMKMWVTFSKENVG